MSALAIMAALQAAAAAAPPPLYGPPPPGSAALPSGGVSLDDYPPEALREGIEGTVEVSYTIGPDGRVHSCVVTVSSGHPALDRPTCALVERRLFYRQPATDANGNPVSAVRTQRVHWVLPDDDPPPPVYPPRR